MKAWLVSVCFFLAACGRDLPPHSLLTDEPASLSEKLSQQVLPFVTRYFGGHTFVMPDGRSLRYLHLRHDHTRGTVVILPGPMEFIEKYSEFVFDFFVAGYDVLILDHTGMGHSSKLVQNPKILHIDDFETYVSDIEKLISYVEPRENLLLFAHSTGALIGAHLVDRNQNVFERVAYSSPSFELPASEHDGFFKKVYMSAMALMWPKAYAPGYSDCRMEDDQFEGNNATSSLIRWQFNRNIVRTNPRLWMCGPSVKWVLEVMQASEQQKINDMAVRHSTPLMIFMAKNDRQIAAKRVHDFAMRAPNATMRVFEDARHELYREKQAHRRVMMDSLLQFFSSEH